MKSKQLIAAVALGFCMSVGVAAPLSITIAPDSANPAAPRMGDHLHFGTVIRNDGTAPVEGLTAWISLIQIDKGKEQPVDLEDWSAHKAVTAPALEPGATVRTDWPMRLIQAGHYRVVVSAASRSGTGLTASPFSDFSVREKPVVESARVLPVAIGLPLLLAGALVWRARRT
jgi:hypothetical protein